VVGGSKKQASQIRSFLRTGRHYCISGGRGPQFVRYWRDGGRDIPALCVDEDVGRRGYAGRGADPDSGPQVETLLPVLGRHDLFAHKIFWTTAVVSIKFPLNISTKVAVEASVGFHGSRTFHGSPHDFKWTMEFHGLHSSSPEWM